VGGPGVDVELVVDEFEVVSGGVGSVDCIMIWCERGMMDDDG
jgi:hypothetical protein